MSTPCSVRLPDPLREPLAASAAAERRTFSGQVVMLLETALEARQRLQERAESAFIAELVEKFDAIPIGEAEEAA